LVPEALAGPVASTVVPMERTGKMLVAMVVPAAPPPMALQVVVAALVAMLGSLQLSDTATGQVVVVAVRRMSVAVVLLVAQVCLAY